MFPHTVTLYYLEEDAPPHITVLRGVLLAEAIGASPTTKGEYRTGESELYIPFGVKAEDGLTGNPRQYAGPVEFEAGDKQALWTLSPDGGWFFIKGEAVAPDLDRQALEERFDSVYSVASVKTRDFGSPGLRHWQVGGT